MKDCLKLQLKRQGKVIAEVSNKVLPDNNQEADELFELLMDIVDAYSAKWELEELQAAQDVSSP